MFFLLQSILDKKMALTRVMMRSTFSFFSILSSVSVGFHFFSKIHFVFNTVPRMLLDPVGNLVTLIEFLLQHKCDPFTFYLSPHQ